MGIIKRVCSRCKRTLGYTDSKGAPGGVSHGLCVPCRDATLREAGLEEFIPETFVTEDGEEIDMAHNPESCTNPLCDEPACVETRKNREIAHAFDPEDIR